MTKRSLEVGGFVSAYNQSAQLICEAIDDLAGSFILQAKACSLSAMVRPFPDLESPTFKIDYLRATWLKKIDIDVGIDRDHATRKGFMESEEQCAKANARVIDFRANASFPVGMVRYLERAQRLLLNVLGTFSLDELVVSSAFGGGASSDLPRRRAFQQNKWVKSAHCTAQAIPYIRALKAYLGPEWVNEYILTPVSHGKVATVYKNVETKRVVMCEPSWNMFFQKGIGKMIRKRARRVGLLYPDSQDRHKALAREGSVTRHLTTGDLRRASDSLCLVLPHELLPADWCTHLTALRTPCALWGDEYIALSKFSSMGNGYTFELETLIFWALAKAIDTDAFVSVYGDDIICETHVWEILRDLLDAVGFTPNHEKTFHGRTPFRESCGGHYLNGEDVTPFKLPSRVARNELDVVTLANSITLWSMNGSRHYREPLLRGAWEVLRDAIPIQQRGPYTPGRPINGLLWCDWDEARPTYRPRLYAYAHYPYRNKSTVSKVPSVRGFLAQSLWTTKSNTDVRLRSDDASGRDADDLEFSTHVETQVEVTPVRDAFIIDAALWQNLPPWL